MSRVDLDNVDAVCPSTLKPSVPWRCPGYAELLPWVVAPQLQQLRPSWNEELAQAA